MFENEQIGSFCSRILQCMRGFSEIGDNKLQFDIYVDKHCSFE